MRDTPLTPLHPGLLRLMQIHGAAAGGLVTIAALAAEISLPTEWPLQPGLLIVPALLVLFYAALWRPPRHYRAWGYHIDGDELQVRHGVWVRTHTVVPIDRVQHIDLSQGPLERALGISRLVLHTAGTLHSQILVPGLARDTAERIRDEIRARIREEPE